MPVINHRCHARNCPSPVPPSRFMCRKHWFMVPKKLRDSIWSNYRPGQETDKQPTQRYLEVTNEAIEFVANLEGIPA